MFGFLPLGLPTTRLHQAWLGRLLGMERDGLAATGAVLEGGGTFLRRNEGLAFQTQIQHLLRENFANLDDQVFELGQLGAPWGTFWPSDVVCKVFGDALDVSADFFYLRSPFFVSCHPWLPLEVKAKTRKSSIIRSYLQDQHSPARICFWVGSRTTLLVSLAVPTLLRQAGTASPSDARLLAARARIRSGRRGIFPRPRSRSCR